MLCDKVEGRENFDGELIALASDGTSAGYVQLESWVLKQNYRIESIHRQIRYIACIPAIKPTKRRFVI